MSSDTKKQLHIEGLRGLAIIFIILFHMCPETFPMGFLGVEVFLVITGYLLFAKPFRRGDESLRAASGRFLGKKVKRLLIPTAALVVFTMVLCFFFLTPEDYRLAALTGLFSMVGGSNFYLHKIASDYFSADVSFCPLTHTWYLAVVIQVFLLYLVTNLIFCKCPRKLCQWALLPVGLFSLFWFNIEYIVAFLQGWGWEYHLRSTPDYYSAVGRMWEVLAGAAIPLLPRIRSNKCRGALTGVALLALGFLLAESVYIERPVCMMAAVLSTVILVRYAEGGLMGRLLSLPLLVRVGAVSFSLYLVHYPVIVCYHCVENGNSAVGLAIVAAIVAVAGLLFYRYIETHPFDGKPGLALAGAALALAVLGVARPNAFLWRASDLTPTAYTQEFRPAPMSCLEGFDTAVLTTFFDIEKFTSRKKKDHHPLLLMGDDRARKVSFLLMGDSHAAALFAGMDMQCAKRGVCALYAKTYVVPFSRWEMTRGWNGEREQALLQWLAAHPEWKTIVIAQYWQNRFETHTGFHAAGGAQLTKEESLRHFVRALKDMGKQVVLVSGAPGIASTSIPRDYRLGCRSAAFADRMRLLTCTWGEYRAGKSASEAILQKLEDEGLCRILHIERSLFNGSGLFEGVKDGQRYMYDSHHMTPEGAEKALEGCMGDLLEWAGELPVPAP